MLWNTYSGVFYSSHFALCVTHARNTKGGEGGHDATVGNDRVTTTEIHTPKSDPKRFVHYVTRSRDLPPAIHGRVQECTNVSGFDLEG